MATGLAKSLCDAYTVMGEELTRLRAENERLKADAARFQWVLAQMRFENERDMGPGRHWRFAFYLPRQDPREDPAAAVDAAMAQGKV